MGAPLPDDEFERLLALELERITDTAADENFDRLTRLAKTALNFPVAVLSLVGEERQWFKSRQGLEIVETPREQAFCAHTILGEDVMVVNDATQDPRFSDNPMVTCQNGIRFYAGAPLRTREGYNIGSLCVIDQVPRQLNQQECRILADLAAVVVHEMELRRWAGTDGLTGLYTYEFLDELVRREIGRSLRTNSIFTAAMIELDISEQIQEGAEQRVFEMPLRFLGEALMNSLRAYDQIGRCGDHGLLVVLPGTSLHQAAPVLARLQKVIAELPELPSHIKITANIGATQMMPGDGCLADILARARKSLESARPAAPAPIGLAVSPATD